MRDLFPSRRGTLAAAALAALLALAGCANFAPRYERPAAPVPAQLDAPADAAAAPGAPALAEIDWRSFLADMRLQRTVELALANNRDLRIAAFNIERAQALYGVQQAQTLPQINATTGVTAQRVPLASSNRGEPFTQHAYNVGLGFSAFELDLFGRVRNLREQALQQFLSSGEARRATHISLVSQVAAAWLTLGADRQRLALAQATLRSQQDSLRLTQRRFELGVSSDLDVQRTRTTVETARADVARFEGQVQADVQALQLLVGTPLPPELQPGAEAVTVALPALPAALPSDVLLQRPDVIQAERDLLAANAAIGAARAAFFPRIALTASVGTTSAALDGLFGAGSGVWSFVPQLTLPIFNNGLNRSNLQLAQSDRDIRVASYERAIQSAFREVAEGLAQRQSLVRQLQAQVDLEDASLRTQRLSQARFDRGVDDYLSVLDAQRSLYAAQLGRIGTALSQQLNAVSLYRALGGGWSAADAERTQAAAAAAAGAARGQ